MPAAVVGAVIAAVAAAGTAVYTSDQSRKRAHEAQDAAKAAAAQQEADAEKQRRLDAQQKPKTEANYPDIAAQIKARLASEKNAAGGGGLSPAFYTDQLKQEYPGFEGLIQEIVSGKNTPQQGQAPMQMPGTPAPTVFQ